MGHNNMVIFNMLKDILMFWMKCMETVKKKRCNKIYTAYNIFI